VQPSAASVDLHRVRWHLCTDPVLRAMALPPFMLLRMITTAAFPVSRQVDWIASNFVAVHKSLLGAFRTWLVSLPMSACGGEADLLLTHTSVIAIPDAVAGAGCKTSDQFTA
jgi:hypothetical protein